MRGVAQPPLKRLDLYKLLSPLPISGVFKRGEALFTLKGWWVGIDKIGVGQRNPEGILEGESPLRVGRVGNNDVR
jgi:hypothetical protein